MKDSIILSLPYPVRLFGVQFMRKRNIGFLFTNLAIFLFREANGMKTSDDYKEYEKNNGVNRIMNEMIYYAAVAYCMENRLKQLFSKSLLTIAVTASTEEQQLQLLTAWQNSQIFGAKIDKKKAKVKKL